MQDLSDPSVVKAACVRGLGWGLEHARPGIDIYWRGEVWDMEQNFPPYMKYSCGAGEMGDWMDDILEEYMLTVRSSAALTVNCFGPLMMAGLEFSIGSHRKLNIERFERRTRNGFKEADEPHLDVIACGPSAQVVIDATCIDYLAPKRRRVTGPSEEPITRGGAAEPWISELLRIRHGEQSYRHLDAEHLIERALGLQQTNPDEPATLVYL
jgi:hypothetical protein